jgi:hypothetical protein
VLIREMVHIPIIALVILGISYLWNLKISKRSFKSKQIWILAFFGPLFNVWGLDVLQREFGINSLYGVVQLSAGAWLVFVLATNAKYLAIYGWSKRDFWLDYGGDLLCFIISGLLIYAAT